MKKMLLALAALFAAAASALADFYATLTVNGTPYTQGGAGWSFDGATVALTNAGPFVLSMGCGRINAYSKELTNEEIQHDRAVLPRRALHAAGAGSAAGLT